MPYTKNELLVIETQLEIENSLLQRYNEYMLNCQNIELKKACEKFAARHKNHFQELLNMLS